MAYSKAIHDKARAEIQNRKNAAESKAASRKIDLAKKYPEFHDLEVELAKTGFETVAAFSLPADLAGKKLVEIQNLNKQLRDKRKSLLRKAGLPENYLQVEYTCPKCEDTGIYEEYDASEGISYGSKHCECYKSLLQKFASEEMLRTTPMELCSFADFDLNYYSKSVRGMESPYSEMQSVYNNCLNYAEGFDLDSVSLYFYGRTGLGKTHLSLAIANEVIKKGYNVLYGSVITFLNKLEKEKFGRADAENDTEALLINADLLILDDLGAEFTTAYTTSVLYNVINSRICRGVPTIISSNLDIKELKERYPESIASRIIGNFNPVNFIGDDIRQLMND